MQAEKEAVTMDQIKIGKFIALCRKEKGLTQAQLGERLAVSDRAVSKWETGKCLPDSSIMLDLCDILGITVNELLNGDRVEPEKLQQASEENLIALKKTEEAGQTKSKRFVFLLALSLFVLAGLLTVYTGNNVAKQREREENQKTLSGMYGTVGDSKILTDEAKKVIHLITGSNWNTFLFSYQVDENYDHIKLCCDTYQNGEKTAENVLIDHVFVKSLETAHLFPSDQHQIEIPSGQIHQGYVFIDCANRTTALTDEYNMSPKLYNQDGTLYEDLGISPTSMRHPGTYPVEDTRFGYRYNLAKNIKDHDGKILPEHVQIGEPVYLLLEGDASKVEAELPVEQSIELHFKTTEEILADPESLGGFEICNVFYCIFD